MASTLRPSAVPEAPPPLQSREPDAAQDFVLFPNRRRYAALQVSRPGKTASVRLQVAREPAPGESLPADTTEPVPAAEEVEALPQVVPSNDSLGRSAKSGESSNVFLGGAVKVAGRLIDRQKLKLVFTFGESEDKAKEPKAAVATGVRRNDSASSMASMDAWDRQLKESRMTSDPQENSTLATPRTTISQSSTARQIRTPAVPAGLAVNPLLEPSQQVLGLAASWLRQVSQQETAEQETEEMLRFRLFGTRRAGRSARNGRRGAGK
jgi:hypothetical protein